MTVARLNDRETKRRIAIAALAIFAAAWTLIAYFVPPLGMMAAIVCFVCALLDMGMNGARYAEFAPANLAGAVLAFIGAYAGFPR